MNKNVILLSFFVMIVGQTNESLAYSWPVDGDPNSWSYGYTFAQVVNGERHLGVDIIKNPLTPIRAPHDCKVVISKLDGFTQKNPNDGYGYYLICTYTAPNGEERVFGIGHISRRSGYQAKPVGEYSEGTILGYVGYDDENGLGGPHIHWFDYGEPYSTFRYPGYAPNSYGTDVDYDQNGNYIGGKFTDPIKQWLSYQSTSFVGKYTNGTLCHPILTRYNASANNGHPLGSPVSNRNGGVYVHNWNGVILQDFRGDSTGYYHGYTSIILNPAGTAAHLLKEGFWDHYTNSNGSVEFGAPFTEEITARYANSPFVQTGDYCQPDNEIVAQKFQRVNSTERRTLVYNKTKGGDARRFSVGEFSISSDRSENNVQWYVTKDSNPNNDIPWPKAGVLTPTGRWFTKAITGEQRYNFVRHDSSGNRLSGYGFTAAITEGNEQSAEPNGSPNPTPTYASPPVVTVIDPGTGHREVKTDRANYNQGDTVTVFWLGFESFSHIGVAVSIYRGNERHLVLLDERSRGNYSGSASVSTVV